MSNEALGKNTEEVSDPPTQEVVLSFRVTEVLNQKTQSAANAVGLKKNDVLRLAIDRGIDVLVRQLETERGGDPQ
jgi:hypothetical protein